MFAFNRGTGIPLLLDDATINKTLGHFAKVLVDIDRASPLRDEILVERQGYAFFVGIQYEKLPLFCSSCKMIGHSNDKSKKLGNHVDNSKAVSKKAAIQYVPKPKVLEVAIDSRDVAGKTAGKGVINNDANYYDSINGLDLALDVELRRREPILSLVDQTITPQLEVQDTNDVETVHEEPINSSNVDDVVLEKGKDHVLNRIVTDSVDGSQCRSESYSLSPTLGQNVIQRSPILQDMVAVSIVPGIDNLNHVSDSLQHSNDTISGSNVANPVFKSALLSNKVKNDLKIVFRLRSNDEEDDSELEHSPSTVNSSEDTSFTMYICKSKKKSLSRIRKVFLRLMLIIPVQGLELVLRVNESVFLECPRSC